MRSRRTILALTGAMALTIALGGCVTPEPGRSVAAHELDALKAAYSAEPHDVRIVDRRKFDARFQPTLVVSPFDEPVGTIVVVPDDKFLYLIEPGGKALRYGVAVGASGHAWSGTADVARKAKWPAWHPTDDMRAETPGLPSRIAPGSHNPLGARALYLHQNGRDTLYRIHGTSEPWTIGTDASSGCIRMFNEDVIDLYQRVQVGAKVHVLASQKAGAI